MTFPRVRFTVSRMMIAVAVMGVLFAALQYDVGRRGYGIFLAASAAFAASAWWACRVTGPARVAALAVAALSCVAGWATFLVFGAR